MNEFVLPGLVTLPQVARRVVALRGLDPSSGAVLAAIEGSAGRALRRQRSLGTVRNRAGKQAGVVGVGGMTAIRRGGAFETGQTCPPGPWQSPAMPAFYSHIRDGDGLSEDPDGQRFEIHDDAGRKLGTVPFRAALDPR